MGKKESKYTFVELIRVFAAFLVIVNHTNSEIFLNREVSLTWFFSLVYFFVSKSAVPLFVIVSGYLMLGKIDDYSKCFKRFGRIVGVIIIFSLPYYINNVGIDSFNLLQYLKSIVGNTSTTAFWYIYFYAGVLLMMPFLQRFFNALEKKDVKIFVGLSVVLGMTWPILVHYFSWIKFFGEFYIPLFDAYMGLLFLGGYFRKYGFPKLNVMVYVFGFATALAFNVIATYYEYLNNSGWYLFFDNRKFLPIILQSVCLFALCAKLHISEKIASIIEVVGSCTFGIYLLSDLLIEKFRFTYEFLCAEEINPILAVFVFELIVFGVGFGITFIMKKIPYLRTLI